MFDAGKDFVCLAFLADEHAHKLHPFCLPERVEFLITEMRHKRDACLADGIVAAALRGGDEDDVGIGSKNQFGVELAFHTNLDDAPVLSTLVDVFVEEVLRARDAFHDIVGIEYGEVRQL